MFAVAKAEDIESLQFEKHTNFQIGRIIVQFMLYTAFCFLVYFARSFGIIMLLVVIFYSLLKKNKEYEIIIICALIFSTNLFEFVRVDDLPYLQLGAGMRLNALDLTIMPFSLISIYYFFKAKHKTVSSWFVAFLIILPTIYVIIGLMFTPSPRDAGMNYYRVLFYPAFYFVFYQYLEEKNNIYRLSILIGCVVTLASLMLMVEFFRGSRLSLPGSYGSNDFYSVEGLTIVSAGKIRLYLWGRSAALMLYCLPIFLAFYLQNYGKKILSVIFILGGVISLVISSVRVWISILSVASLIVVMLSRRKFKSSILIIALFLIIGFVITKIQNEGIQTSGTNLIESVTGRVLSILNLGEQEGEQNTFTGRVVIMNLMLNKSLESPIWGQGFGQYIWDNYSNNDLGIMNRFLFFGLLGTLPLLYFIFKYIYTLFRSLKKVTSDYDYSVLIAVIAIFVSHLLGYLFQQDIWGSRDVFVMVMAMASADRILADHPEVLVNLKLEMEQAD